MPPPHIKAMILAAGLGTRLKPFTEHHPKALFKSGGITLLEHALLHLAQHGIREVVINVHHFADQILGFLKENRDFGMKIRISDETDQLLETGGGVKHAEPFLSGCDAFVVRNVDVISDLDLTAMLAAHLAAKPVATLAVRSRETSRYFLFDDRMILRGWLNKATGEERIPRPGGRLVPFAFSGIQVLDASIFPLITETGRFSLTDLYIRLCGEQVIRGYEDRQSIWSDAGNFHHSKPSKL